MNKNISKKEIYSEDDWLAEMFSDEVFSLEYDPTKDMASSKYWHTQFAYTWTAKWKARHRDNYEIYDGTYQVYKNDDYDTAISSLPG